MNRQLSQPVVPTLEQRLREIDAQTALQKIPVVIELIRTTGLPQLIGFFKDYIPHERALADLGLKPGTAITSIGLFSPIQREAWEQLVNATLKPFVLSVAHWNYCPYDFAWWVRLPEDWSSEEQLREVYLSVPSRWPSTLETFLNSTDPKDVDLRQCLFYQFRSSYGRRKRADKKTEQV